MANIDAIIELQDAAGANAKLDVLRKYENNEWFRRFLYYALNPLLTYNISEKTLRKTDDIPLDGAKPVFFNNIFDCCDFLSKLRGIDDATVRQVRLLIYKYTPENERDIYIKLISKTLRLGVTAKTVNKIIDNLIPEWEVQQAYSIEKYPLQPGTEFWLTQKLNGVRATYYNGMMVARSGVPFNGLTHIIDEICWVDDVGLVLDGELTLLDKGSLSDNEAFRVAIGILNSDSMNKTGICFTVFDAIPVIDFDSERPQSTYSKRRQILDELSDTIEPVEDKYYVSVLPILYHGTDQNQIDILLEQMVREDKEGLMVNTDVPYKRTRHKGILKVKRFYTMDLPILRCEEGTGRLSGTLGAFVLEYKGNEVKVGSGFTDEQRSAYWDKRDNIVGSLCEVKYKEISSDKNTGYDSLQFPVFVQLRFDKTDISYD